MKILIVFIIFFGLPTVVAGTVVYTLNDTDLLLDSECLNEKILEQKNEVNGNTVFIFKRRCNATVSNISFVAIKLSDTDEIVEIFKVLKFTKIATTWIDENTLEIEISEHIPKFKIFSIKHTVSEIQIIYTTIAKNLVWLKYRFPSTDSMGSIRN